VTVWLNGNALVLINEVELRWAQLVAGWITVFERVNHLAAEPATHIYSAWRSLHGYAQWVPAKAGE